MNKQSLSYYEDYVIFKDGEEQYRFATYVRPAKKSIFELVIVIPREITKIGSDKILAKSDVRKIVNYLKTLLGTKLNDGVALEFATFKKLGRFEKLRDSLLNYARKQEEPKERTEKRTFKGFVLQEDNTTAINESLGITIKLEVGLSGCTLYYKRNDGKSLTCGAAGDILGEVLYCNTVNIETPYRWDKPSDNETISNHEMSEIKDHIKSAMELYESLVFFKEVARRTEAEKDAYIQKQLEIISQRKIKKAANE